MKENCLNNDNDGINHGKKFGGTIPGRGVGILLDTLHLPAKDWFSAFDATKGGHLTNGVCLMTLKRGGLGGNLPSPHPPCFHIAD